MSQTNSVFQPDRKLEPFLVAPATIDSGGFPVTVLSMLARLDIDPWNEGASLARLSRKAAVQRLASLIDRLPGSGENAPPSRATAARLVSLLPSGFEIVSESMPATVDWRPSGLDSSRAILIYVALVGLLFVGLGVIGTLRSTEKGAPDTIAGRAATTQGWGFGH